MPKTSGASGFAMASAGSSLPAARDHPKGSLECVVGLRVRVQGYPG